MKTHGCGSGTIEIHTQTPGDGKAPIAHYTTGWPQDFGGIGALGLDYEPIESFATHDPSLFLIQRDGCREGRVTLRISRKCSGYNLSYCSSHTVQPYIEKPRLNEPVGPWDYLQVEPPWLPNAVFGFDTPLSVSDWNNGLWQVARVRVIPESVGAPGAQPSTPWVPGQIKTVG